MENLEKKLNYINQFKDYLVVGDYKKNNKDCGFGVVALPKSDSELFINNPLFECVYDEKRRFLHIVVNSNRPACNGITRDLGSLAWLFNMMIAYDRTMSEEKYIDANVQSAFQRMFLLMAQIYDEDFECSEYDDEDYVNVEAIRTFNHLFLNMLRTDKCSDSDNNMECNDEQNIDEKTIKAIYRMLLNLSKLQKNKNQ